MTRPSAAGLDTQPLTPLHPLTLHTSTTSHSAPAISITHPTSRQDALRGHRKADLRDRDPARLHLVGLQHADVRAGKDLCNR